MTSRNGLRISAADVVSALICVLTTAACAAPSEVDAKPSEGFRSPRAQVWLVSTRHLPGCLSGVDAQPEFWRLGADHQWAIADETAFVAGGSAAVPTIIYIHGNRTDREDAVVEGLEFLEELRRLASGKEFRYVIWSWPADRIRGRNRRDVQVKDARSRNEALYLARTLARIPPDSPISLIGYSFGAQTILGALEWLAEGAAASQMQRPAAVERPRPVRAVLIAAAVDNTALSGCDSAHRALRQVDRLLVTRNACDPALRLYSHLYRGRGASALGFTGPVGLDPNDPNSQKVEVVDVSCAVGKNHGWIFYRGAGALRSRLPVYTFLQADGAPGPTQPSAP